MDNLTSDEKECLALIVCEKAQTNSELQSETGKKGWEINRLLSGLTSKGFLISNPNGRWTTYEPNTEFYKRLVDKSTNSQTNSQTDTLLLKINGHPGLSEIQKNILSVMVLYPFYSIDEISKHLNIKQSVVRYQRIKMKHIVDTKHEGANQKGRWKITFLC
ncbi:MAG: hypothetical protein K2K75_04350 [Muribaculaceae bacterium]|nr:hypothetical protein [Muribaculaceae bacterium]